MTESAASGIASTTPRLSMAGLGLVAGLAGLWVYTAVQQSRAHGGQPAAEAAGMRSALRRTRTIRRHRRQQRSDAIASEIRLEEAQAEPGESAGGPPVLPPRPSYAERRAALGGLGGASDGSDSGSGSGSGSEAGSDGESGGSGVGMKLLHLLCTISEQHARTNGVVHRGTACSNCQEAPIRGVRYKCAQCASVDLCGLCEAHDFHAHHVLLKMHVPLPSLMNPRAPLVRRLYPGSLVPRQMPREVARRLEDATYLDRMDLAGLYAEFCVLATQRGDREVLTRAAFYACLGPFGSSSVHAVLAQRLFAFYSASDDDYGDGDAHPDELTFDQLARGFSVYTRGTLDEKAPRVFRAYDVDADGRVGRGDVRVMLEAFARANREMTRGVVRAMERDVVEDVGRLLPGQPVSAAFTAPVAHDVPTVLDKEVGALRAEVLALRETAAAARRAAAGRGHGHGDEGAASDAASVAATTAATAGSLRLARRASEEHEHEHVPGSSGSGAADPLLPRPMALSAEAPQPAATFWHDRSEDAGGGGGNDDGWPLLDALGLDAVRIMVDDIFDEAAPADPAFMSFDEFAAYLHVNPSLALYLEMLGSIF
ncbi:hypothetical protein LPJ53_000129 [Coemansia erecta]|uniref:EF-hand n=1 Tax=Coemansia erecta TaxID=147472 RepID=A0A9W8CTF3_9FUNG|nr:hypothetical protein LPJ53_000129 [Coemansia erecta]